MNVDSFCKLIDRVTRRTSRNIAIAEATMKVVEKTAQWVPAPKPLKQFSSLNLFLGGDGQVGWTATDSKRGDDTWKDFLRWYHGRTKSRVFVMEFEEGSTMIRRKDIKRYEIRYWETR